MNKFLLILSIILLAGSAAASGAYALQADCIAKARSADPVGGQWQDLPAASRFHTSYNISDKSVHIISKTRNIDSNFMYKGNCVENSAGMPASWKSQYCDLNSPDIVQVTFTVRRDTRQAAGKNKFTYKGLIYENSSKGVTTVSECAITGNR